MFWPNFIEFGFSLDLLFEGYMIWGPTAKLPGIEKEGQGKKSTDKQESQSLGKET